MNPFDDIHTKSRKWRLSDEGIELAYDADFLPKDDADRLFEALKTEIDWRRVVLRTPGGPKTVPRMMSWHADERVLLACDGLVHVWHDWTRALRDVRGRLRDRLGVPFDGVLASFHENERDMVPFHAHEDIEEGTPIASVSLGWTRELVIRHEITSSRHIVPLEHGSLILMSGDTQRVSRHAVPKSRRACGARISLTFRVMRRADDRTQSNPF